jgi:hypothetical protein
MSKKSKLAAVITGAALAIGGQAAPVFAAALCGDVNNSGGNVASKTCWPAPGDACDATDSVGIAQVAFNGGCPGAGCVASQCGGSGSLQCGDIAKNGSVDIGDYIASLRVASDLPTTTLPCTDLGPTVSCPATKTGSITANEVWPSGCTVFIDGTVLVQGGVTVTIAGGVTVKGKKTSSNGTPSALIFLRGSQVAPGVYTPAKINMTSDAAHPIVMTSDQTAGSRAAADWGGLSLNGAAPVNFAGGEGSCEGLPPGTCNFGGTNPNDSSGQIRFVRIEFSGVIFSPDNELNVLTQNGIGRGTTMEYIQANVGNDDGIEWFGGTVNEKHLVSSATQDDNFDWQIGYTGSVQYGLSIQNASVFSSSGQNGFEADNNEFGYDLLPRSNPNFCNITMIGCRQNSVGPDCGPGGATVTGSGALLRRGTAGKISNTIIMDYPKAGIEITQDETLQQGCVNGTTLKTTEPYLLVRDSILYGNGGGAQQLSSGGTTSPPCTSSQLVGMWQASEGLNITGTNPLPALGATYPASASTDAFFPASPGIAAGAPSCQALNPSFFDSTNYVGAFKAGGSTGAGDNWLVNPSPTWISFVIN